MAHPVAQLGDTSDHGGSIVTASATFNVGGVPVARVGDTFDCPKHGKNPIVTGSATHAQDGKALAHVGSKTACGATITTGSATFMIGD
jgi:uncharacterized Zn-binding protein involved in type VI secretion